MHARVQHPLERINNKYTCTMKYTFQAVVSETSLKNCTDFLPIHLLGF